MTLATIRKKLHDYIDSSDESSLLEMLELCQNTAERSYNCSREELDMLHERADNIQRGQATLYTVREAHDYIKQNKKAS